MRLYRCPHCGALLFFDSLVCVTCGRNQAYDRASRTMLLVEGASVGCLQRSVIGCNWATAEPGRLCDACALTRTRPNDLDTGGLASWAGFEAAKRHLIAQLDDLALPVWGRDVDGAGLAFDFLSSAVTPVMTGHAEGVITIDLAEGFDPHRETRRIALAEPYRTVLGHLRHEIGHWYLPLFIAGGSVDGFEEMFGDPSVDYAQALRRHYAQGPPADWVEHHVSAYAAAHPWEDWAETFAHYLHLTDTLQSADSWGLQMEDQYVLGSGVDPVSRWVPLSVALNTINRSMGRDDLYPFVLTPPVLAKLRFVQDTIQRSTQPSRLPQPRSSQQAPAAGSPVTLS